MRKTKEITFNLTTNHKIFMTSADPSEEVRKQTWLKGTLPAELSLLSDMEYFTLPGMEIEGSLEGLFETWSKVRLIRLEDNQIVGKIPSTLSQDNPLLEWLDISDNLLTGEVPTTLSNLNYLKNLRLGTNSLGGNIPGTLGTLGNLSKLLSTQYRFRSRLLSLKV